jgi:hypothetical protein
MRPFTPEDGSAYITALKSGQEFDLSPFRPEVAQRAIEAPSAVLAALKTPDLWGGAGIEFETVLMRGIAAAMRERQEREARGIAAAMRERQEREARGIVAAMRERQEREAWEIDARVRTSGTRETDPTRAAIETAIRALPIAAGREDFVEVYAAAIAQMVCKPTPVAFLPANGETVEKQLTELRDRATRLAKKIEHGGQTTRAREQLARLIDRLYHDTINALGCGLSLNVGYVRHGLPADLRQDTVSPAVLRIVADAARAALVNNPQGRNAGREPNHHARAVACSAARTYAKLTGERPAISGSTTVKHERYVKFVLDLFIALDVRGEADYYAVQAARALKAAAGNGNK